MVNRKHESQKLTYRVDLPGGQERLRELILHVSAKSADMQRFGLIKLNKIIWKADFSAFLARGTPVTGRAYQRLQFGPAPVEMRPLLAEMVQDHLLDFETVSFGHDADGNEIIEMRPVAVAEPSLHWFSPDDLAFVHKAIDYYRPMTGTETSDDSHGMAWRSRSEADPLPYESAYLSEKELGKDQLSRVLERAREYGWRSR